jgi:hypothetical protein
MGLEEKTMKFRIIYALNGTRGIDVTLPEGTELPSDWSSMTYQEKDEWIYSREIAKELSFEDIDYAGAVEIVPL